MTDTYHVHKKKLAVGPRKSAYSVVGTLFSDGGRFAQPETQTSRIELDEIAAKSFHQLLPRLFVLARS